MKRKVLRWLGLGTALGILGMAVGVVMVIFTAPSVDALADSDPTTTAFVDRALGSGLQVQWVQVPFDAVALDLKLAIVVSEDLRFFEHGGFDGHEIWAAVKDAAVGKRLRGASTITQQLARNLWLTQDRSLSRKLSEAVLAWKLDRRLTKRRILELYFNTAIFGADTVGVEAAAQRYFGLSAAELSRVQAAELAATLPAPTKWYPGSGSPRAGRHARRILERMDWPTGLDKRLRQ